MYAMSSQADAGVTSDQAAFVAAMDQAHARSFHSYFTQYVLIDEQGGYIAIDEGDYGALPTALQGRVIDTVPGRLSDEF